MHLCTNCKSIAQKAERCLCICSCEVGISIARVFVSVCVSLYWVFVLRCFAMLQHWPDHMWFFNAVCVLIQWFGVFAFTQSPICFIVYQVNCCFRFSSGFMIDFVIFSRISFRGYRTSCLFTQSWHTIQSDWTKKTEPKYWNTFTNVLFNRNCRKEHTIRFTNCSKIFLHIYGALTYGKWRLRKYNCWIFNNLRVNFGETFAFCWIQI